MIITCCHLCMLSLSGSLLWPKARFLARGLARSGTLRVVKKKSRPAWGYRGLASIVLQVISREQKQFKSQKHFNLRLLKSRLLETHADNSNGSVLVILGQPRETRGPIKINLYNDTERIHTCLLFSYWLLPKSSGNREVECEHPSESYERPCKLPPA